MKSFSSPGQFAAYLGKLAAGAYKAELVPVLQHVGDEVKKEVEKEIGEYQSAIGPYPDTAPLSPVTLEIKQRRGLGRGGPDTPLYATGEFSERIGVEVHKDDLSVEIGTTIDHVVYTELGTSTQPARPVFGPAALRVMPKVEAEVAAAALTGIIGGTWAGLGLKAVTHADGNDTAELT
jgi:hypothetical protein